METQLVDSKRKFLSRFFFSKLMLVGLFVFILLLVHHAEIPILVGESRTDLIQPKISYADSKVRKTLKKNYKVETEGAIYRTEDMSMKHHEIKYINKTNYLSDGGRRLKESIYYGKDDGSDYIKTKYIMHKLLNENGQNLSARQRANLVKERCQIFLKENNLRLNPNKKCKFDREFMVSRSYNLTVCYNCKVASSNIKRVLYVLDHNFTGDINNLSTLMTGLYCRTLMDDFQQIMSEKRHNINVMLVREPLERLLSAYRDKRPYWGYFKNPSFPFKEYLKLILDEKMKKMDRHIYPYFERCRPCEMQYDFIVAPNQFDDDVKTMLQAISASRKPDVPKRNETGYAPKSSDKLLKQYFSKIPNDMIHKLWEIYYKDYYIFGFPYPSHLMH
ncbi:carbohydrate sulfotransferase 14-like [Mercenaria mercenaria]|uniref:carbohydrate sulfotransferase 14-like n=1 Tax=Mercenaria mercenaria TaxID=6596 RepID=UPI00234EA331|nr:carbohydrate sulfotransferase 14-like [Mercenaria mercenaria]